MSRKSETTATVMLAQCESAHILCKKIDALIDLIPGNFPRKGGLVQSLRNIRLSIEKTPPEEIGRRWDDVGRLLNKMLPDGSKNTWARQAAEILWPKNLT
jgi:hypothetical protein